MVGGVVGFLEVCLAALLVTAFCLFLVAVMVIVIARFFDWVCGGRG